MLTIKFQAAFRRDYKRIVRRGYDVRLLENVVQLLAEEKPLPEKNRDHALSGDYIGCRECHIPPDWLLTEGTRRNFRRVLSLPFSLPHEDGLVGEGLCSSRRYIIPSTKKYTLRSCPMSILRSIRTISLIFVSSISFPLVILLHFWLFSCIFRQTCIFSVPFCRG